MNLVKQIIFIILTPLYLFAESNHPTIFKIGAILPLSGEAASLGQAAKNGIEMSHQDLPLELREKTKLIIEDDGLVTTRTVSAYRKLTSIDKVNGLICWSSTACNAIAPLAEQAEIPLVAIASDPSIARDKKYVVNFWVTPEEETKLALAEALKRGYKKIAIVHSIQDGVIACKDAFVAQNNGKIEIARTEGITADSKDFRTTVTKLRQIKDLDGILTLLMPGQIGVFAKQVKQAGIKAPLFGYETLEDKGEVAASNGALIGAWFSTSRSGTPDFEKRYFENFPGASIVTANNAYDSLSLLSQGVKNDLSSKDLSKYLRELKDFNGASGTFSATGDNRFTLPAVLKVVESDGFKELYSSN